MKISRTINALVLGWKTTIPLSAATKEFTKKIKILA
jgi:hypothetical protein